MMSKWSSRPANHNAVRLRNNQRRHRQRAKNHVAELEASLAETRYQLEHAKARIVELSQELESAKRQPTLMFPQGHQPTQGTAASSDTSAPNNGACQLSSFPEVLHIPDPKMASEVSPWHPSTNTAIHTTSLDAMEPKSIDEREYCNLPPPDPGKSTTRCRDAYFIIHSQNYKALDSSVIRGWLEPGFRGEVCQGDGCRVDTDLLFTLLDFISSPD